MNKIILLALIAFVVCTTAGAQDTPERHAGPPHKNLPDGHAQKHQDQHHHDEHHLFNMTEKDEKHFHQVWKNMTKDDQKNCTQRLQSEFDKIEKTPEFKKMNETEKENKVGDIFRALNETDKACALHMFEEHQHHHEEEKHHKNGTEQHQHHHEEEKNHKNGTKHHEENHGEKNNAAKSH